MASVDEVDFLDGAFHLRPGLPKDSPWKVVDVQPKRVVDPNAGREGPDVANVRPPHPDLHRGKDCAGRDRADINKPQL